MNFLLLVLLLQAAPSQTPNPLPSIEPTWVYSTPIKWERIGGAPRNVKERWAGATVVVLYPAGEYVEIVSNLYRSPDGTASIPGNDGLLIRTGTWARTDDDVIRIHSREVLEDKVIRSSKCDKTASGVKCSPPAALTLPSPFESDTCALQGQSPTHLAGTVFCKRIAVSPVRINFDLTSVEARVREGLAAAPLT
jgi:hypothetical protein